MDHLDDAQPEPLRLSVVRDRLGRSWGLDRALTYAELARALSLAPTGGEYLSRVEKGKANLGGTADIALRMMLDGAVPYTMRLVVKAGYPR
jgi:hypothetical protein